MPGQRLAGPGDHVSQDLLLVISMQGQVAAWRPFRSGLASHRGAAAIPQLQVGKLPDPQGYEEAPQPATKSWDLLRMSARSSTPWRRPSATGPALPRRLAGVRIGISSSVTGTQNDSHSAPPV